MNFPNTFWNYESNIDQNSHVPVLYIIANRSFLTDNKVSERFLIRMLIPIHKWEQNYWITWTIAIPFQCHEVYYYQEYSVHLHCSDRENQNFPNAVNIFHKISNSSILLFPFDLLYCKTICQDCQSESDVTTFF